MTKEYCVFQALDDVNTDIARRFLENFETSLAKRSAHNELEALNRYWRHQLGMLNIDTTFERGLLIDCEDFESWLQHFRQYVIVVIVKHNLPFH